jgi:hypothetical protein
LNHEKDPIEVIILDTLNNTNITYASKITKYNDKCIKNNSSHFSKKMANVIENSNEFMCNFYWFDLIKNKNLYK